MINKILQYKLEHIPHEPGCYLWRDKYDQVIYVGKATDLYKRTHQYFLKNRDLKTSKLVEQIFDLDYVVVNNENESLILENNLIKKYQPKYNILLKNGNNYPYIGITKELHPRLIYTHDTTHKCLRYYGPFAAGKSAGYNLFKLLEQIFKLRKCYKLKKDKCLYYDIGQCLGPCINEIHGESYKEIIKQIDEFFSGKYQKLITSLRQKELDAAKIHQFEDALRYKELIEAINTVSEQQNINLLNKHDIDVIGYYVEDNYITIVIFTFNKGKLITKKQQINEINNNDVNEVLASYLNQFYFDNQIKPKKCYVGVNSQQLKTLSELLKINFINPHQGQFKEIMLKAYSNAKDFYHSNYHQHLKLVQTKIDGFNQLKSLLNIDNLSLIHMFDTAFLFNEHKVGGMISIEYGEFNKNLYRRFNIKSKGNNDLDYTHEVILRQYKHILDHNEELPNLIIADGGINQVNAIKAALKELKLVQIIPTIGLIKNNKHQTERILLDDGRDIPLVKNSPLYFFLAKAQDEVHRFAISFHRNKYQKSLFHSRLDEINGMGKSSINLLLNHYENLNEIKNASVDELSQLVGIKIATIIKKELK